MSKQRKKTTAISIKSDHTGFILFFQSLCVYLNYFNVFHHTHTQRGMSYQVYTLTACFLG